MKFDTSTCFLLFIGLCVLSAGFSAVGRRRADRRMREWADGHGWSYTQDPEIEWRSGLPRRDSTIRCTVTGPVDDRVVTVGIGSYSFRRGVGVGSGSRRYDYVVAAVRLADHYPPFAVHARPIRYMFTIGSDPSMLGYEPFDVKFEVVTDNPADMARWLTPPVVNALVDGQAPAWSLAEGYLLVYRPGVVEDPQRIPEIGREAVRMAHFLGVR
ncbi:MAG TPA: hypothetical protein VFO77_14205 [Actinoplanes sp.]|nr:hypothetical protein [Actinoplanes sp.]